MHRRKIAQGIEPAVIAGRCGNADLDIAVMLVIDLLVINDERCFGSMQVLCTNLGAQGVDRRPDHVR